MFADLAFGREREIQRSVIKNNFNVCILHQKGNQAFKNVAVKGHKCVSVERAPLCPDGAGEGAASLPLAWPCHASPAVDWAGARCPWS